MRNISLRVSYDGTAYHGWQCQPGLSTIQETLHKTIERITNQPAKLVAGARTDAGVHAEGQVVNFLSESGIELMGLTRGINSLLPPDIRVVGARVVPEEFHSRFSAKSKTYAYRILNAAHDSPFYGRYAWHISRGLDVRSMDDAIQSVKGTHDFASFKKKNEPYRSTVREVLRAGVKRRGEFIYVVLEGTGFLRYMVRNIVGTLVLAASGRLSKEGFREIIDARDRVAAGPTAPARGLVLREILY